MKVRNTNIIQFDLINKKATIQLTPLKSIEVDGKTVFASRYATGWGGYFLIKDENGKAKSHSISSKVARQISKYFEYVKQDFNYDYFVMPFDKFQVS